MPARTATDWTFLGAAIGFTLAIAEFIGLMWLAFRIERRVDTATASTTACLLRLEQFPLDLGRYP